MANNTLQDFKGLKYEQVKSWIRKQISDGAFPVGSLLPSQAELPEILNVGSTSVRRALDDLKKEGLIIRKKKAGSFVASSPKPLIFESRKVHIGIAWTQSVIPNFMQGNYFAILTEKILNALDFDLNRIDWTPKKKSQSTQCSWQNNAGNIQITCMGDPLHSHVSHPRFEDVVKAKFDVIISVCIENEDWLKGLIDTGTPVILVDFAKELFRNKADQIFFDPAPGYVDAVRHFASLGFQQIHFVGDIIPSPAPTEEMGRAEWHEYKLTKYMPNPDSAIRLSVFRNAMHECKLVFSDESIHHAFHREEPLITLGSKLSSLSIEYRPDVVIGHSIYHASVIADVFNKSGLSIPFTGATYDSSEVEGAYIYADLDKLAQTTAELVISRLNRPKRVPFRLGVPMVFITSKEEV